MIVYLVQMHEQPSGDDWSNTFCETVAEARKTLDWCTRKGIKARLDKLDVETTKAGFVEALNSACHNHMNQRVIEEIARNY